MPLSQISMLQRLGTVMAHIETPPTDEEINFTNEFVETGLKKDRFSATFKAANAIGASSIKILFTHLPQTIEGTGLIILRGKVTLGASNIGHGLYNSFRSFYNIMLIFSTATLGLALRHIMYTAVSTHTTSTEDLNQKKQELEEQVKALGKAKAAAQSDQIDPLNQFVNSIQSLDRELDENSRGLLARSALELQHMTSSRDQAQAKLEQLQGQVHKLESQGSNTSRELETLRAQISKLEQSHAEAIKSAEEQHARAIQSVKQEATATLQEQHKQVLEQLNSEHQRALGESQAKAQKLESQGSDTSKELEEFRAQISKLEQSHAEAIKSAEQQHALAIQLAKQETTDTLQEQHRQALEKLNNEHQRTLSES
nr:hypothetical protein [Rhabdochlamydiaceae bacterium]